MTVRMFWKRYASFFILVIFIVLPTTVLFQNCGKGFQVQDSLSLSSVGSSSKSCSTGNSEVPVGSVIEGYTMQTALAPVLCGTKVQRTCLDSRAFNGSMPIYQNCDQSCKHPDNSQPVSAASSFPYIVYTKSAGDTQADCDAAKVTSYCQAATGEFAPTVPTTRFTTCQVRTNVCSYTTGAGYATPTGNKVNDTVMGYALQSAMYPTLCGSPVTRTCQSIGAWTGSVPLYTTCAQKCVNPENQMPVDAGAKFTYYTQSFAPTQVECNAARIDLTCQASTGLFSSLIPQAEQRFNSCTVVGTPKVISFSKVSVSQDFICGITTDAKVLCWGSNQLGTLGYPIQDYSGSTLPLEVAGLRPAKQIANGYTHACIITDQDRVMCWGEGRYFESFFLSTIHTPIDMGITGAKQITAGSSSTCVLLNSGKVMCWGNNFAGQVGDGTTNTAHDAVEVSGLSGIVQIASGDSFVCALTTAGQVKCWGDNKYKNLGNDSTLPFSSLPVDVPGINGAKGIYAHGASACVISSVNSLQCWGIFSATTATDVAGMTDIVKASIGVQSVCGITSTGKVKCTGGDFNAQLGIDNVSSAFPAQELQGLAGAQDLSSGVTSACVVNGDNSIRCWGESQQFSTIGHDGHTSTLVPIFIDEFKDAKQILTTSSSNQSATCLLTSAGTLRCGGSSVTGFLGSNPSSTNLLDIPGPANLRQISVASNSGCGVTTANKLNCWHYRPEAYDASAVSALNDINSVAVAWASACALTNAGTVLCWGNNFYGELGNGTKTLSAVPIPVNGISNATQLVAGFASMCAVLADKTVNCWGHSYGTRPVAVSGAVDVKVLLSSGNYSGYCALKNSGDVLCFDDSQANSLLRGLTAKELFGSTGIKQIAVGDSFICGMNSLNRIKCYGDNSAGQLGNNSIRRATAPVDFFAPPGNIVKLFANLHQTCVQYDNGAVACAGQIATLVKSPKWEIRSAY